MKDYKPLHYKLFNACTDALEALEAQNCEQAKALLIAAQQAAEELYISEETDAD